MCVCVCVCVLGYATTFDNSTFNVNHVSYELSTIDPEVWDLTAEAVAIFNNYNNLSCPQNKYEWSIARFC